MKIKKGTIWRVVTAFLALSLGLVPAMPASAAVANLTYTDLTVANQTIKAESAAVAVMGFTLTASANEKLEQVTVTLNDVSGFDNNDLLSGLNGINIHADLGVTDVGSFVLANDTAIGASVVWETSNRARITILNNADANIPADNLGDNLGSDFYVVVKTSASLGHGNKFTTTLGNNSIAAGGGTIAPAGVVTTNEMTADTQVPAAFTVGTVTPVGGTVVAGRWNASNTDIEVKVPVPVDASLQNGTVQLRALVSGEAGYVNLSNAATISVGLATTGGNQTFTIDANTFENLAGFANTKTVTMNAIVTDNATNATTGTASASVITIDQASMADFTVGAVVTTGGTVVAGKWNSTNTGINVTVPIADDATVEGGTIQLRAKVGNGALADLDLPFNLPTRNVSQVVSVNATTFQAIAGLVETSVITINAVVTDNAGNPKLGTQSNTTITIDRVAPTAFDVVDAAATGGTVVADYWNSTNTGVSVTVQINNDATLNGGTVQLLAKVGSEGAWQTLAGLQAIAANEVNTNKAATASAAQLEALTGFAEGVVVYFGANVTDSAGNPGTTNMTATSANVTVDQAVPAAPSIPDLHPDTDSGADDSDNVTSFLRPRFTGTAEAGSTVTISGNRDGGGYNNLTPTATATGGNYDITLDQNAATGSWVFRASARDAAGNDSANSDTLAVTIAADNQAPVKPAIADLLASSDSGVSTDNITSDNTPTFSGTAEARSTVKLYKTAFDVNNPTTNKIGEGIAAAGTGAWEITISQQADGTYPILVVSFDGTNYSPASDPMSVTIDTVANAPTIDLANDADDITALAAVPLTGTAEGGAAVTIYDGSNVLSSVTAAANGTWTYTTQALTPGVQNFRASQVDVAGNPSLPSAGYAVTIDITAPDAPSTPDLTTATDSNVDTDNITSANDVDITGTAEKGARVDLYDNGGANSIGNANADANTGVWTITINNIAAGAHSITAKATDTAGNQGVASGALSITVDRTAPAAPSAPDLATASDDGTSSIDNVTSITTPTFTGTAEAGSTVQLFKDGNAVNGATATANGTGDWTITVPSAVAFTSGNYVITADATDTAGNMRNASAGLNITIAPAPTKPNIALQAASDTGTLNNDGLTNDTTPTFDITGAIANNTVKVYDGATEIGSANASSTGTVSVTVTLESGEHSIAATTFDSAGYESLKSTALAVTVDTTAPTAPTTLALSGATVDNITTDTTPDITGAAEANSTVKLYEGATELGNAAADNAGAWTITSSALSVNTHSLTAKATDAAGNTSEASSALSITVATYTLSLVSGNNLVSFPLYMTTTSPATLLSSVASNVTIVYGDYDPATDTWKSYVPGAESNSLTTMRDGKGYWLSMGVARTLELDSFGVTLPTPPNAPPSYSVVPGWNLIGFKSTANQAESVYLAGIANKYTKIYKYTGGAYQSVATGADLEPGLGYWVAVTGSGTIFP